MRAMISARGDLYIERPTGMEQTMCPFKPHQEFSACDDKCPLFEEVVDGSGTRLVYLRCSPGGIAHNIITDERKAET